MLANDALWSRGIASLETAVWRLSVGHKGHFRTTTCLSLGALGQGEQRATFGRDEAQQCSGEPKV